MPKKQNLSLSFSVITVLIIVSFLTGSLGGILSYQYLNLNHKESPSINTTVNEKQIQSSYLEESSVIETVKTVSPAVVSVIVSKDLPLYYRQNNASDPFSDFFNDPFFSFPNFEFRVPNQENLPDDTETQKRVIGGGSGFIFSKDGLIVTNKHVVEDTKADYTVILNDGTEYSAQVLGRDPLNDLAVLKIQAEENKTLPELPTLKIGNSEDLQVGQKVVAIGNALAEYENTVTVGVISGKERNILAGGSLSGTESLSNLLQTDAAINPGNSGGPLCNLAGEVIGINVAVASNANGIGFAIPINDAKQVIESVKKYGKIVRPMLGVRYVQITPQNVKELNLGDAFKYDYGALISGDANAKTYAIIPGSPAEKAGLMRDDIILEVDGVKVQDANTLRNIATTHQIGDKLKLTVWRNGKLFNQEVELGEVDTEKEAPEVKEQ